MCTNVLNPIDLYSLDEEIAKGHKGSIYKAKDKKFGLEYAMKVRDSDYPIPLQHEIEILQELKYNSYFPGMFDSGEANKKQFLVLELLGPTLSDIETKSGFTSLSISTSIRLALETLRCIQAFHEKGFIHRDIKPSHFLLRPSRRYPIALIDFSLSHKINNSDDQKETRTFSGFVGTMKYASVNAHEGKCLGRCDDLFSWYSTFLEMLLGNTPWVDIDNNMEMAHQKNCIDIDSVLNQYPTSLVKIHNYIRSLAQESIPNYNIIYALLVDALKEAHGSFDDPYDWEKLPKEKLQQISSRNFLPDQSKPIIPEGLPSISKIYITPWTPSPKNNWNFRNSVMIPIKQKSPSADIFPCGDQKKTSEVSILVEPSILIQDLKTGTKRRRASAEGEAIAVNNNRIAWQQSQEEFDFDVDSSHSIAKPEIKPEENKKIKPEKEEKINRPPLRGRLIPRKYYSIESESSNCFYSSVIDGLPEEVVLEELSSSDLLLLPMQNEPKQTHTQKGGCCNIA